MWDEYLWSIKGIWEGGEEEEEEGVGGGGKSTLKLTYDECVERFLKAWEKTGMDDNEDEVIRMQIREGYCTPLVEMVARRRALIGPGQHQRQQLQQQQRQEQHLEIN